MFSERSPTSKESSNVKWLASVAYTLSMGCCGIVLVAIGSTFETLANQVNRSTTEIGTVFLMRGLGSIFGTISCSKLFSWFSGNYVLSSSLALMMFMLFLIPFSINSIQLHVYFFFLGFATITTDTGCQLMTRKLHGKDAGPWLGVNATIFGLSAAFVPILELISTDLIVRYFLFCSIIGITLSFMLFVANANANNEEKNIERMPLSIVTNHKLCIQNANYVTEKDHKVDFSNGHADKYLTEHSEERSEEHSQINSFNELNHQNPIPPPHYYTEITIAIMLFFYVGGGVTATAYLETFISETKITDEKLKEKLFLIFWLAITVGRITSCYYQRFLDNKGIIYSLSFFSVGGFLSIYSILFFTDSKIVIWIGIIFYGFMHGPTVGYCQDLNNRLTILDNGKSMSIVMFGLVLGASFLPFLTGYIWKYYKFPQIFLYIVGISMLIPLPLIYVANYVSYLNKMSNNIYKQYNVI